MAVLVRKLSKRRNADALRNSDNVDDLSADIVMQEFKTSKDTLSAWETAKDSIDLGVLAIALSSEHFDTMDFILLDKECAENTGLFVKPTKADANPLAQASEIHRDFYRLRLQDFRRLALVYKDAASDDANVVRYTKTDLERIIRDALRNGWVDSNKANDRMRKVIESLSG